MNRTIKDGVLTAMDSLVLVLIVDCGFTPTAIIGACYVLLRFLNRDSARFVDGLPGLIDRVTRKVEEAIQKARSKKTDPSETENEAQ